MFSKWNINVLYYPDIYSGELPGRSGAIQAAINLEIGMERISRLNIKLEGINGQLPNLDLVNTAVRLCKKERIAATLQKRVRQHSMERICNYRIHPYNLPMQ